MEWEVEEVAVDSLISAYRESREWVLRCIEGNAIDLREYFNRGHGAMQVNRFYSYARWSGWEPTGEQLAVAAYLGMGLAVENTLEEDAMSVDDPSTLLSLNALGAALLHPTTGESPMLQTMYRVVQGKRGHDLARGVPQPRLEFTEKLLSPLMERIHPEYQVHPDVGKWWENTRKNDLAYLCCEVDTEKILSLHELDELGEYLGARLLGLQRGRVHIMRMMNPMESTSGSGTHSPSIQLFTSMIPREERLPGQYLSLEDLAYIEHLKSAWQEETGEYFAFIDEVLLPHVMAITPRKLHGFISLAREYNIEWAMACYDWGDDLSMTTRRNET